MAKRTAIIDIGSNSISIVVYEKSSRFAFSLIKKARAGVKIGEGAYEHGGVLQKEAMDNAYSALEDFVLIASNLKCRKILTVATSALRDAPNRGIFLKRVRDGLKLSLKIIDGKKEAYFGGVATSNLLFFIDEFTMVDIGGGSTELAKVKDGKVINTHSLNIGTVRLKELMSDKSANDAQIKEYITSITSTIPKEFKSEQIVGIGGTLRSLSSVIMAKERYPIDMLHGFEYRIKDYKSLIKEIPNMNEKELKKLDISTNRFDTIREGVSIFYRVLKELDSKYVIASKAGVREGVYLSDLLRNSNHKFASNFNISIKSLMDRYALNEKNCSFVQRVSKDLFDTLKPMHDIDEVYKDYLGYSAKLSPLSSRFNIYSNNENSFYFLLENLNFSFSHEEKLLVALLLKLSPKEKKRHKDYKKYDILLPDIEVMEWLYFMLTLSRSINANRKIQKIEFKLINRELIVKMQTNSYLTKQAIEKLKAPLNIKISVLD
jgi:exopolyphosphatase/guanosine-5'-triphosphate,3'-diphosphate pyrophosphatase